MSRNAIHSIILHIWILSILGSPLAILLVPEEYKMTISLNDGWEEESEASDVIFPDFEKLAPRTFKFHLFYLDLDKKETLVTLTPRICNHVSDVIIPPPEGSLF